MESEVVGIENVNLERLTEAQEVLVEMVHQAKRARAFGTLTLELSVQSGVIQRITTHQKRHIR